MPTAQGGVSPSAKGGQLAEPFDIDNWEPIRIGPTWARTEDGQSYVLPEHTVGWEALKWCAKWLKNPDTGAPWQFTAEQARFILWLYAVDADGQSIYRRSVLQRLKGAGKDPLAAALAWFECCGPCRFSHFDEDGEVVGRELPAAWVQLVAVSLTQTKNTSRFMNSMITDAAIAHYDIDLGQEVIYSHGRKRQIQSVTSSFRALEGARVTFVVKNETHHWVSGNGGHEMSETIAGNVAKIEDARSLDITNAYMPGEDSVAQRIREGYERTQQGLAADFDLLYDSLEAPPNAPLEPEAMEQVVSVIRGDAFWVNPKNAVSFALSSEILPARARRMFYNQIVAEEDQIYTPTELQAARVERAFLEPGDEIVLGFDGGKTDDATALVAIRLSDRVAFPIGIWERPNGKQDWYINRPQVDSAVHDTFSRYNVRAFFADVTLWESYIEQWSETYGPTLAVRAGVDSAIGWDMSSAKRTTRRHEALVSALKNGRVKHNGDPLFMQHIANVRRRVNQYGLSFGKESRESRKKIDAYAALLAAHAAMTQYIERGAQPTSTAPSDWWAF